MHVLRMTGFDFVPEKNLIALMQLLVLVPMTFTSMCGVTLDPFSRLKNVFTALFIPSDSSTNRKKNKKNE